jgi:hypothetical protein
LTKNRSFSTLFYNRNTATLVFVALFIIIWLNPSQERLKNTAENYILSQKSNISQVRVQEFLNQNFSVNNYLLFSTSNIIFQNKEQFIGIGFLAYVDPGNNIYKVFIKWEKSIFNSGILSPIANFIKLDGNVNIKHINKINFNDVYLGENIYNKDSIRIGQSPSFSAIQYIESKSIIKIRENTVFQLNQYNSSDEINLVNGTIINDINIVKNRLFSIKTSLGTASIKGTVFAVKLDQSKGVAVFIGRTGRFEVQNPFSGEVLTIDGRQKITSTINGDFDLEPATISDFPIDPTVSSSLNNNNFSKIRKYDFDRINELLSKENIQPAIALFNANILQYPLVTSDTIQIIVKEETINILPLYRDGFFMVSDDNGKPIGYIDEFDIQFESDQVIKQIKEYSSNNFLDSNVLVGK